MKKHKASHLTLLIMYNWLLCPISLACSFLRIENRALLFFVLILFLIFLDIFDFNNFLHDFNHSGLRLTAQIRNSVIFVKLRITAGLSAIQRPFTAILLSRQGKIFRAIPLNYGLHSLIARETSPVLGFACAPRPLFRIRRAGT